MSNIRDYMKIVEGFNEGWTNPFARKEPEKEFPITNPAIKGQHATYAEMSPEDDLQYHTIRDHFKVIGNDDNDPHRFEFMHQLRLLAKKYAGTTMEHSITKFINSIH